MTFSITELAFLITSGLALCSSWRVLSILWCFCLIIFTAVLALPAAFLAEASVALRASPVGGGIGTVIVVGASVVGCCGTSE